jgi:ADP-ribose pyrophosphatase YjhB (NUDIX family)
MSLNTDCNKESSEQPNRQTPFKTFTKRRSNRQYKLNFEEDSNKYKFKRYESTNNMEYENNIEHGKALKSRQYLSQQHQQHQQYKQYPKTCLNCGKSGHLVPGCNEPPTSYGVICVRIDPTTNTPKYLMIRRKDSLSFLEFMRGHFEFSNMAYMMKMLENMSTSEKQMLLQTDFDSIWQHVWGTLVYTSNKVKRLYPIAKDKIQTLRRGLYFDKENGEIELLTLENLIARTEEKYHETEWEFPKGRRNKNELDFDCGKREFYEETQINPIHLTLLRDKPYEEKYKGTNNRNYRNIYYAMKMEFDEKNKDLNFKYDKNYVKQSSEISGSDWYTFEEVLSQLREHYGERKELIRRIHKMVMLSFIKTSA